LTILPLTDPARPPPAAEAQAPPLAGVRVVEFTHMVMGPTCGMILGDLGAEVIKVEPIGGDATRRLLGSGAGFFPMFNRNKKSLAVDIHDARGREIVLRLLAGADVFSENFRAGAMEALGFGTEALTRLNPRLVCVSHKGFLPGPYAGRTALDEVVQMMGGLAYMTGPEGRPLRAGSSVNDIMGGMFGAIGVLAALRQRDHAATGTGRGAEVQSGLFENNVLLVAQHMMQFAVTGQPAAPMPGRISAWAVYDVFTVHDGEQIFLAAVSDRQWAAMCGEFGFSDLLVDPRLASNNLRVQARDWMLPQLRERFAAHRAAELAARFDAIGLPYAPITRPHELFDDPHLRATGGLAPVSVPADASSAARPIDAHVALLPLTIDGQRLPVRLPPPSLGADTEALLQSLGYGASDIAALLAAGVVRSGTPVSPQHEPAGPPPDRVPQGETQRHRLEPAPEERPR
jgi:crotonobetainyl-CoA:carnitine CoA-transferase CaiB-like acyl-CoA transferase